MNTPSTQRPIAIFVSTLTAAVAVFVAMSLSNAVAGSPLKGAERLAGVSKPAVARSAASTANKAGFHAACDSCTSVSTSRPVANAKGGEVLAAGGTPTAWFTTHGCGGCTTTLASSGHGKARVDTSTHGCARPGIAAANCCAQ